MKVRQRKSVARIGRKSENSTGKLIEMKERTNASSSAVCSSGESESSITSCGRGRLKVEELTGKLGEEGRMTYFFLGGRFPVGESPSENTSKTSGSVSTTLLANEKKLH